MQSVDFKDMRLSRLGFGAMRLPQRNDNTIDEAKTQAMVDYAIEHGVNYFDTAHPYLGGYSEIVLGRCLAKHERSLYYLATKYPGHQIADSYDPEAIFEEQLHKCGVDYFDFYLLHNIYESSIDVYMDPHWGILDYFIEQKERGRIRSLGFSTHGRIETIEKWLDYAGKHMEFAQLQVNYLDWSLQDAKEKCDLVSRWGLPVIVMEPIRGGALANISDEARKKLEALRPGESPAAWALRWCMKRDVAVILSGMSTFEQLVENVATFDADVPLSDAEEQALYAIADSMRDDIPCTACRYCTDTCPEKLDIPTLLDYCNDMRVARNFTTGMQIEALAEDRRPGACTACNACTAMCPQNIDIPLHMKELAEIFDSMPRWADLSRKRAQEAERLRSARS